MVESIMAGDSDLFSKRIAQVIKLDSHGQCQTKKNLSLFFMIFVKLLSPRKKNEEEVKN